MADIAAPATFDNDGVNLDAELVAAMARVRSPGAPLPSPFARLGFSPLFTQWGAGRVRFDWAIGTYEPDPDAGERALIIGACRDGDLIDLAAVRAGDHRTATRLGIADALGLDVLDASRFQGQPTRLFADPLDWLRDSEGGIHVVDLRRVRSLFSKDDILDCGSQAFEARVRRAFWTPPDMPKFIATARSSRHAA